MRMLRMLAFQFRQFISVPYFVQLMLVATLTTTLIQYLAQRAWGGIDPPRSQAAVGSTPPQARCLAAWWVDRHVDHGYRSGRDCGF